MKSLQEYIIEAVEYDEINEGKIWDAIKNWWNNLFSSSDKKYDVYSGKLDPQTREEYISDLKQTFDIRKLKLTKVNPSSLDKIVNPSGVKPNKETNDGFWQFTTDNISNDSSTSIYGLSYVTDDISDTPVLFKVKKSSIDLYNDYLELIKIQIIDEYNNVLPLNKVIQFILDSNILTNHKGMICLKDVNKELYNKLFNDCDFIKETVNNKNLVKFTLDK